MAELVVMRTTGTEKEILSNSDKNNIIHLFIVHLKLMNLVVPYEDRVNTNVRDHECGDFLTNTEYPNTFALIVKETINDRIIPEALRVAVLNLIKTLLEEGKEIETILINNFQFSGRKDEIVFINTLKEFLMTYFGEIIKDPVTLIICGCKD